MSLRDLALATLHYGYENIDFKIGVESDTGHLMIRFFSPKREVYVMKSRDSDTLFCAYDLLTERLQDPVLCMAMTMEDE